MKRLLYGIILCFLWIPWGYSLGFGLTFGPVANEQYLIEDSKEVGALSYYDIPQFFGGAYWKADIQENAFFYYGDLTVNIHNGKIPLSSAVTGEIDVTNYLVYFHNDINFYLIKRYLYMGLGMELLVINSIFSEPVGDYNFYIAPHYFCYIDGGINIPLGKVELGLKFLYRILPFSFSSTISGKGEITCLFGLKLGGGKKK